MEMTKTRNTRELTREGCSTIRIVDGNGGSDAETVQRKRASGLSLRSYDILMVCSFWIFGEVRRFWELRDGDGTNDRDCGDNEIFCTLNAEI